MLVEMWTIKTVLADETSWGQRLYWGNRVHSCFILAKNSSTFYPCPESLSEAKFTSNEPVCWGKFQDSTSFRLWYYYNSDNGEQSGLYHFQEIDGIEDHYVECDKPSHKSQISHVPAHSCNLDLKGWLWW
jgi:hypothetical protein